MHPRNILHRRPQPLDAEQGAIEHEFATSAGVAGQKETPFSSHHLAKIGAARGRACTSAASTGYCRRHRVSSPGFAQRLMDAIHFLRSAISCTCRRRLCGPESISPLSSGSRFSSVPRASSVRKARNYPRSRRRHRLTVSFPAMDSERSMKSVSSSAIGYSS